MVVLRQRCVGIRKRTSVCLTVDIILHVGGGDASPALLEARRVRAQTLSSKQLSSECRGAGQLEGESSRRT